MKNTLWLALIMGLLLSAGNAMAVDRYGASIALYDLPQESDMSQKAYPIDLFYDQQDLMGWGPFRFGLNYTQQSLQSLTLTNITAYGAYRYPLWWFELLGGLGLTSSSLSGTNAEGNYSQSALSPALVAGIESYYDFGSWQLGGGYALHYRHGQFDGNKLATGSNQIRMTILF